MALLEELVELINPADAQCFVHPLAKERVVKDDVEPECLGAEGRRGADAAAAHDAERLAAEARGSHGRPVVPGSGTDCLEGRHQAASQGEQEHDRVIGDFLGPVVGHVADDHAVPSRGLEVDIIKPDPGPDHAPALRCPSESWPRRPGKYRERA